MGYGIELTDRQRDALDGLRLTTPSADVFRNCLIILMSESKDTIATTARGCYFGGSKTIPLEGITLDNVQLTVGGEMDDKFVAEVPDPYRVWEDFNICAGLPHALYFRDASNIRLRNCRVRWQDARGFWQSALTCERVDGLDVTDSHLPDPPRG